MSPVPVCMGPVLLLMTVPIVGPVLTEPVMVPAWMAVVGPCR